MSKEYVIVPKEDYVDTCDAIREKINSTTLLKSDEMAQAIRDIPSPKEEQEKTVDITENGTTEIIPDENKVLSKVTVNVGVEDSYYDTFWDNYQQLGERTSYSGAFGTLYWNNNNFTPKYDIIVTKGNGVFRDCGYIDIVQRLKENNVSLDTSNATDLNYAFYGGQMTSVPTISVAKTNSATHLFLGCSYLHTIEKFIVHSNFTTGNVFHRALALQNITIEGEIGTTFDIKWSPLTAESAKSIITHLVNYTGTENEFVHSVLFADSVWELLNAEGATAPGNITWEEYVNSIGWNK